MPPGLRATVASAQGATINASIVLTIPAAVQIGDLLYAVLGTGTSGTGITLSGTGTTGFTNRSALAFNANTNPTGSAIYYRFATAADIGGAATYTWTMSASNHWSMTLAAFSGVDSNNPFDAALAVTRASTSAASAAHPAITATAMNDLLLAIGTERMTGTGTLPTFSVSGATMAVTDNTTSGSSQNGGSTIATQQLAAAGAVSVPTTTFTTTCSYNVISDLLKAQSPFNPIRSRIAPISRMAVR